METKEILENVEQDAQNVELKEEELAAVAGGEALDSGWQVLGSYEFAVTTDSLAAKAKARSL